MQIIPLNEGLYSVSQQKVFSPIERARDEHRGLYDIVVCPFLIITRNELILLDTGLAATGNGQPLIVQALAQKGFSVNDITLVLLSHLHKDHLGGIGYWQGNELIGLFANATIYLQQRELEFALTQQHNPSYNQTMLNKLSALPNLKFQEADRGTIAGVIDFAVTGGHTPYHQSFWIKENEQVAFYGADNLPQEVYLHHRMAYKSDDDGKKALELRYTWQEQALAEHWSVLFYHDTQQNVKQY